MFWSLASMRFSHCSKLIANIVVILIIARVVASFNLSDVSGRDRITPYSPRLTRQQLLMQEVEKSEDSVKRRRTRYKYGNVKLHELMPSNIIVEELHTRTKIHFQARPRTCRDLPATNKNCTKYWIDSKNPLPRRIIRCFAESLINNNAQRFEAQSSIEQSNNRSISIARNGVVKKKTILLGATTHLPYTKNAGLSRKEKNISPFVNEEENPLPNVIFNNTELSGMSNFEVDKPLSLFYSLKEKYHKLPKRDDKFGFPARFRRSIKSMENKRSRLKRTAKQISNKMDTHYRGTRRKEFLPDSKIHNHNEGKRIFSFDTIQDMLVDIPGWGKNYGIRKISTANTKDEKNSTTFVPFFDDYEVEEIINNKFYRPRSLFVPDQLKKKMHKNSKGNEKSHFSQACHKKSKKILNYDTIPVEVEKRSASIHAQSDMRFANEQETFDRRYDNSDMLSPLSLSHQYGEKSDELSREPNQTALKNNNIVSSIDQKNITKTFTNTKKKPRSENSSEKEQSKLSKFIDKLSNTTKERIQMGKQPYVKAWNFNIPPVFAKFIAYVSSFSRPLFGIDLMGNNNQSELIQEENTQAPSLNVSQEELGKNVSAGNSNTFAVDKRKLIPISMGNSFPNSTGDYLSNSTNNNLVNSTETFRTNSTEILFANSKKKISTNSTDIEMGPKILAKNINPTNRQTPRNIHCRTLMETSISNDCANYSISMDDKNNEQRSRIGKHVLKISNFSLAENTSKLSNPKESTLKIIPNFPNDRMKNSSATMSTTSEDFSNKTTVNFTITDPNCNSPPNNSVVQSSIIVEKMVSTSTYPTLKRYSRNDTFKVHHGRNNNGKTRHTKNSLNSSKSPNAGKKVQGGIAMTHRKNRIRIEGKHPVRVDSPTQNGKNLWRKNNGSVAFNRTRHFVSVPIARENGKSTTISVSRELLNSSFSKTLPDGALLSSLSSLVAWREIQFSSTVPPFDTNIPYIYNNKPAHTMRDVDSSQRPVEFSSPESEHSDLKEKMTIGTTRSTFSTGDSFSKEINDSASTHLKVESTMTSHDFFTITVATKSIKPVEESRQDQIIKIEETSAGTLMSQPSTFQYDALISVNLSRAEQRNNSTIIKHSDNGDIGRNKENPNKLVTEKTRNEDITNMSATLLKLENLSATKLSLPTGESRQELDGLTKIKIVNNIVKDESSTFFYNQSTFTVSSVNDKIVSLKQHRNKIGESSPMIVNEILGEGQNNTLITSEAVFARNGGQAFLDGDSTKNQTNIASMTEETQKYSSTTEQRISSKYSKIFLPSSSESGRTERAEHSTEFVSPMTIDVSKKNHLAQKISTRQDFFIPTEISALLTNSTTPKYKSESFHDFPVHLENSMKVNVVTSANIQNSTKQELVENFGSALKTVTETQSAQGIKKKISGTKGSITSPLISFSIFGTNSSRNSDHN